MLRLLVLLLVAVGLIWVGWEKPFKERVFGPPKQPVANRAVPPIRRALPVVTPTPASWMWDKDRKSALDQPVRR